MLDRSARIEYWDDFFVERWPPLSRAQTQAVAAWVRWLEAVEPDAFFDNTYERVQQTLSLLQAERGSA